MPLFVWLISELQELREDYNFTKLENATILEELTEARSRRQLVNSEPDPERFV
jgi:hypothetical protein